MYVYISMRTSNYRSVFSLTEGSIFATLCQTKLSLINNYILYIFFIYYPNCLGEVAFDVGFVALPGIVDEVWFS